eukprot:NODE_48_length_27236_cov_0.507573.p9 type:complete len:111 gc:universal NODE_48_length_27236_cov_0.507573:20361-20029(-)
MNNPIIIVNITPLVILSVIVAIGFGKSSIIITNKNSILIAAVYTNKYINPKNGTPILINITPDNANVNTRLNTDVSIFLLNIVIIAVIIIIGINMFIMFIIVFLHLFHPP